MMLSANSCLLNTLLSLHVPGMTECLSLLSQAAAHHPHTPCAAWRPPPAGSSASVDGPSAACPGCAVWA
jgi:hypothetical protein